MADKRLSNGVYVRVNFEFVLMDGVTVRPRLHHISIIKAQYKLGKKKLAYKFMCQEYGLSFKSAKELCEAIGELDLSDF